MFIRLLAKGLATISCLGLVVTIEVVVPTEFGEFDSLTKISSRRSFALSRS